MADRHPVKPARAAWRDKWYIIIFQHGTPAGRLFDIILLTAILLSVLAVILESVPSIRASYDSYFYTVEWIFTGLFTLEYLARLATARNARRYAFSFFGIVDLLAVAPIYLSLLFAVSHSYTVVRSLRLLRVFRILKLEHFQRYCRPYPQCENQAEALSAVMARRASARAPSRASTLRALAERSHCLIFDQACSMGLKSGE